MASAYWRAVARHRPQRDDSVGPAFSRERHSLSFFSADTLLHLGAFLDIDDLACLARTCRKLHNTLARELLKQPVDLWPQDLESYLAFLTRLSQNPSTSFPAAWNLSIDFQYLERHHCTTSQGRCVYECRFRICTFEETWELLGEILQHAHGLSGLALKGCVDRALSGEELRVVLDVVPALRSLTLGEIRQDHLNALQGVVPDLRALILKYHVTLRIPGPAHAPSLGNHFQRLEELEIYWFFWNQEGVQLPNMKKLKVNRVYLGTKMSSWAGALVRTFPNLTHLDFWEMYSFDSGRDVADRYANKNDTAFAKMLAQWRDEAEALQRQSRHLPLRYIRVRALFYLYCLGLSSAMPGVRVYVGVAGVDDTMAIARALRPLAPQCVGFFLEHKPNQDIHRVCRELFRSCVTMPSFTHVVMNVPTMQLFPLTLRSIAGALACALQESSVSHVLVRIQDTPTNTAERSMGRLEYDDLYAALDRLIDRAYASAPAFLAEFLECIPEARRLFLELEGYGLTSWERSNGDRRWRELDEAEGRQILAAENMSGWEMDEVPYRELPPWDRFEKSPVISG